MRFLVAVDRRDQVGKQLRGVWGSPARHRIVLAGYASLHPCSRPLESGHPTLRIYFFRLTMSIAQRQPGFQVGHRSVRQRAQVGLWIARHGEHG